MARRLFAGAARRVAERREYTHALREHDEAMRDSKVALEHVLAIDHARSRGEHGCMFCS